MFSGAVLIIIAVLIAVIVFANGEVSDKPVLFETNAEYVEGIDVSSHNGQINWKSVANSTDFCYNKSRIQRLRYRENRCGPCF